jgi:hypothetical protein
MGAGLFPTRSEGFWSLLIFAVAPFDLSMGHAAGICWVNCEAGPSFISGTIYATFTIIAGMHQLIEGIL